MITIGIDPILFSVGPFAVRWYSLFVALAIVVGVYLSAREARRKGISEDEIYSLAIWVVIGGIIGSRLFHVIDRWDYYARNPLSILALQEGGLAIYGGLIVGTAAGVAYALRRHLPVWRLLDTVAPGAVLGQGIGRIGCIINGCSYGVPTSTPPAFIYVDTDAMLPHSLLGVSTQPVPLYELVGNVLIFSLLWRIRGRSRSDGPLFLTYAILYSAMRLGTGFLRQEQVLFLSLQQAQVIALAIIIASAAILLIRRRRSIEVEQATSIQ